MFGVALTVKSCLQSGTRADVAWIVESRGLPVGDWGDAVVFTPGGGRTGTLLGGALDGRLAELAGLASSGRLVDVDVGPVDALIAELDSEGAATCLLVPGDSLPEEIWERAIERQPFAIVVTLDGDVVTGTELGDAGEATVSSSVVEPGRIVSTFVPVPELVVVGANPVADALARLAPVLGWRVRAVTEMAAVGGVIAPLSPLDKVVVTGHDLELAGSALATALESRVGYIASLGSRKMQADRNDWLAYRGVTEIARIHGPAGIDIGASTPAEIAVSIVAEAIAEARSAGS